MIYRPREAPRAAGTYSRQVVVEAGAGVAAAGVAAAGEAVVVDGAVMKRSLSTTETATPRLLAISDGLWPCWVSS